MEFERPQVVLRLAGELDIAETDDAYKRLLSLPLPRGSQLVLDLRDVTFLDSTGVRLILRARDHATRHGAGFVLVRGPDPVMRVLNVTGLDSQFDIVAPR
jgi:anti-sigma B factor antagonist